MGENEELITDRLKLSECLNNKFFQVFSKPGLAENFPIIPARTPNICKVRSDRFSPVEHFERRFNNNETIIKDLVQ